MYLVSFPSEASHFSIKIPEIYCHKAGNYLLVYSTIFLVIKFFTYFYNLPFYNCVHICVHVQAYMCTCTAVYWRSNIQIFICSFTILINCASAVRDYVEADIFSNFC